MDKDHEIQKTYRYDAFGIILKETGSDGELSNRLTYTGQINPVMYYDPSGYVRICTMI